MGFACGRRCKGDVGAGALEPAASFSCTFFSFLVPSIVELTLAKSERGSPSCFLGSEEELLEEAADSFASFSFLASCLSALFGGGGIHVASGPDA